MTQKKWIAAAAFAALVALVLVANLFAGPPGDDADLTAEPEEVPAEVAPAYEDELTVTETVSGLSSAQEAVAVMPALAGRIEAVNVNFGDEVERGQEIARLEGDEYQYQVRQAQAAVDAASAQLDGVRAGPSEEQIAQLEAQVDQALAGLDGAKLGVEAAEEGFSEMHQQLVQLESQVDQAEVARRQAEEALRQVEEGTVWEQAQLGERQARKQLEMAEEQVQQLKNSRDDISDMEDDFPEEITITIEPEEFEGNNDNSENNEEPNEGDNDEPNGDNEDELPIDNGGQLGQTITIPIGDIVGPALEAEESSLDAQIKLAELEEDLARMQLEGAEISRRQVEEEAVKEAELALEQAEASEEAAREQLEMMERMVEQSTEFAQIDERQADAALTQAEAALQEALRGARAHEIDAARAGVREAQAALGLAQHQFSERIIQAPISGQVTELDAEVGQMAGPEAPLAVIVNPDALKVEVQLTDRLVDVVAPGDEAKVLFPARGDTSTAGTVTAVANAADPETGAFMAEVTLEGDAGSRPGEMVDVELVTERSGTWPTVPRQALLEDEEGEYVFVVRRGLALERRVQTGVDDGERVAVTQGLDAGEPVLVRGQNYVEHGQRVDVQGWHRGDST